MMIYVDRNDRIRGMICAAILGRTLDRWHGRGMSLIEIEELLEESDPDTPSGENLEYDPLFGDLERSAQGKPEQQFGDTIVPSEEPEWNDVRDNALAVLSRSKDLRAAVHLGQALTRTDGFQGICDTLGLVRGYVERYWETVHPQLDPEDDNDPTERVNALAALADGVTVLRHLREIGRAPSELQSLMRISY